MMRSCVVLDGQVINIGEWNYQLEQVEVTSAVVDAEGNEIEPAVYETVVNNPFPEGATIEQRDFLYSAERGWHEVDTQTLPTIQERLEATEQALLAMMEAIS